MILALKLGGKERDEIIQLLLNHQADCRNVARYRHFIRYDTNWRELEQDAKHNENSEDSQEYISENSVRALFWLVNFEQKLKELPPVQDLEDPLTLLEYASAIDPRFVKKYMDKLMSTSSSALFRGVQQILTPEERNKLTTMTDFRKLDKTFLRPSFFKGGFVMRSKKNRQQLGRFFTFFILGFFLSLMSGPLTGIRKSAPSWKEELIGDVGAGFAIAVSMLLKLHLENGKSYQEIGPQRVEYRPPFPWVLPVTAKAISTPSTSSPLFFKTGKPASIQYEAKNQQEMDPRGAKPLSFTTSSLKGAS